MNAPETCPSCGVDFTDPQEVHVAGCSRLGSPAQFGPPWWPNAVSAGWDEEVFLGHSSMLRYGEVWRFAHLCERGSRGTIVCAPSLEDHTVTVVQPGDPSRHLQAKVTVEPSVLCGDCGLHGWVRESVWTGT